MGFLVCLKIHCRHNVFFAAKFWQIIWWRQPIVVAAPSTQGVLDSDSFTSKPLQFYQVRRIDWRVWSKTLEEVSSVTTCETKAKLSCQKTHSLCVWLKLCRIHPWTYFALLVNYRSCQSPFSIRENIWKVWMYCRQWQSTHRCVKKVNPDIKWKLCFIHYKKFTSKTQTVKCCFMQFTVVIFGNLCHDSYSFGKKNIMMSHKTFGRTFCGLMTEYFSVLDGLYPGTFGTKLRRASKEQSSIVVVVWWSWLLCCFRNGQLAMKHKFSTLPENPKGQCPSINSETCEKKQIKWRG